MKKYVTTPKGILTTLSLLFSIIAGIFLIDAHYCTTVRADALELSMSNAIQQSQKNIDIKFYQYMLEQINNEILFIKKMIRLFPNDTTLLQDLNYTFEKKKKIQEKLDKAIES